jgi:uncharacterized membrane protein
MDAVARIALWASLFVGTHLVISSHLVRPRLIAALGRQPYNGLYSLIALATFMPLLLVFGHHKHAGTMLWNLRAVEPVRWLTWILMFAAFIFLVAGLINPNPGALGARLRGQVRGILKVTRHPTFVAIALFAVAHLLMNGWLGDVIFFGSFALLAILGGFHQDRRKLREIGEPYRELMAQTSFFPGTALVRGRQRWSADDVPWAAIASGVALTIVVLILHPRLFGGYPLG